MSAKNLSLSVCVCVSVGSIHSISDTVLSRALFFLSLSLSHPLLLRGLLSLGPKRPRKKLPTERQIFFCLFSCCLCCCVFFWQKNWANFCIFFVGRRPREKISHTHKKRVLHALLRLLSLSLSSLKRREPSHAHARCKNKKERTVVAAAAAAE